MTSPRKWLLVALALVLGVRWLLVGVPAALDAGFGSDVVRQWVVAQYALKGVDPFRASRDVLEAAYGDPQKAGKIFSVPRDVPERLKGRIVDELGAPEATYPPPAVTLFAGSFGLIGQWQAALGAWAFVNVILAAVLVWQMSHLLSSLPGAQIRIAAAATALLLFPAAFTNLERGQFAALTFALLLASYQMHGREVVAGLALGLALLKPSISLPFFVADLAQGRLVRVVTASGVQLVLWLALALWLGRSPLGLAQDWRAVTAYFVGGGMYTAHDFLELVRLKGGIFAELLQLVGLGSVLVLVLAARKPVPQTALFSVVCVVSVLWSYHQPYDLLVLLPALLILLDQREHRVIAIGLFAVIAIGLMPEVTSGSDMLTKALRWLTRAAILGLLVFHLRRMLAVGPRREKHRELQPQG